MSFSSNATLEHKVALVTGAARRIGATIVRRLHAGGAAVAIHYHRSAAEACDLRDELNTIRANSAEVFPGDLSEQATPESLVAGVVDWAGRLDVLVNNASSFYPTPIGSVTEDQWSDLVATNLKAPLFLAQAAWPQLKEHHGNIVNLLDIHAARPLRHHLVYGSAKAGLAMLTRSLAKEMAPEVRVNGVSPGAILWPEQGMSDSTRSSILRQIPLGKAGDPEDIAGCVLWLVRDAAYVTGQIVAVDGGRSLGW